MNYFTVIDWVLCGVGVVLLVALIFLVKGILSLRCVVAPNEVHIIRQGKKTLSYGSDVNDQSNTSAGNSYYKWPA